MGIPSPFHVGITKGTDHATPFSYDTHVPLAFYGLAFQPGIYRTHAEPVDLAVTLASLLGINAPAKATGRVLTEALQPPHHAIAPPIVAPAAAATAPPHWGNPMTPIGNPDLSVSFAGIELKNPIIAASGTFGYGIEFADILHLDRLGGLVVKGLSKEPMTGKSAAAPL